MSFFVADIARDQGKPLRFVPGGRALWDLAAEYIASVCRAAVSRLFFPRLVPEGGGPFAGALLASKSGRKPGAKPGPKGLKKKAKPKAKPAPEPAAPGPPGPEDEDPDGTEDDAEDLEEDGDEEDEDEDGGGLDDSLLEDGSGDDDGSLDDLSDPELIEGFLAGDGECFERLVVKYQHKVHNLCFRIMGDRDEALDMAQEVFITAHKSLSGFRGDSQFSTWIFRVTVNHCKNRIKYLGRRRYYQTMSLDQPMEVGDGEVYYEVEDESPDPELTLVSEEAQALVQGAIASLDPDHRVAVALRDIQGLSYEEIAEVLGIKTGTVKSRIHRARSELKKKLEARLRFKPKV